MLRAFQNDGAPGRPARATGAATRSGNHDGGVIRFGRTASSTSSSATSAAADGLQNLEFGPRPTADRGRRPVRRPRARRCPPHRRRSCGSTPTAPTPRDNPFFQRRRARIRRRGRREPSEGLRLRHPQQLRHGRRPVLGRPVDSGERRRHVRRDQRVTAGLNSGWIQTMGPLSRVDSSSRSRRRVHRSAAAVPLAAVEHRRLAGRSAATRLFMLRAPTIATRSSLAVRGGARRNRLRAGRGLGPALRRRSDRRRLAADAREWYLFRFQAERATASLRLTDSPAPDRVADNSGQVRHHRERIAALRPELRRRHGYSDRTERKSVCRVTLERGRL